MPRLQVLSNRLTKILNYQRFYAHDVIASAKCFRSVKRINYPYQLKPKPIAMVCMFY